MRVYFDIVFILNFILDFSLLVSVAYLLKRVTNIKRIILGSLVGSLSMIILFYKLNSIEIFVYKVIVSILMIIVTFKYKNLKYFLNNFLYLYIVSIVLGGSLYLLNNNSNIKNNGLLFIHNPQKINLIIMLFLSPLILYFYLRQCKKLKNNYNNYYRVELVYKNDSYMFTAFLDTGNKLKDQYKNRPIILINTDKIDVDYDKSILVPYETVSGSGVLKCIEADYIVIDNNKLIKKPLIGLTKDKFNIEGIDMILNNESL